MCRDVCKVHTLKKEVKNSNEVSHAEREPETGIELESSSAGVKIPLRFR